MEECKKISFGLLSKYRGQLMGFAIILIMFTHNTMKLPGRAGVIASGLGMLAQSGVDIFFFLSGFGCFFSLSSKSSLEFYKKRIIKIIIPYVIVLLAFGIFRVCIVGEQFFSYISRFGLVTFFTKAELSEWFIAAILATYLVTPAFFGVLKKSDSMFFVLIGLLYAFIAFIGFFMGDYHTISTIVRIWVTRLPAFLVGMLIAKYTFGREFGIPRKYCSAIIAMSVLCIVITLVNFYNEIPSFWLINRLLFLPVLFGTVLVYILICEKRKSGPIQTGLKWLGTITLEIYLLHVKVLSACDGLMKRIGFKEVVGSILSNIVAIVIAIGLAITLHVFVEKYLLNKKHSKYN